MKYSGSGLPLIDHHDHVVWPELTGELLVENVKCMHISREISLMACSGIATSLVLLLRRAIYTHEKSLSSIVHLEIHMRF